ncbi:MAG TPA: tetratricopeptide repeat protein [Gemmataceae bacterium]|nr:tetratricopeptide repeat protein [Gemmataceae bacterium]
MLSIAQRLALAVRHHEAGRLQEAEALYQAVLQEAPQHPHALHLLGVLAHQAGRHQEAREQIRRALAVHGPHPAFHSNLAAVCLALGLLDESLAHSREALRLQPNLADASNNLGVALRRLGRFAEAESAFRAALRLNPADANARSNLGAVLHRQEKLAEALAVLQEAVRLAPRHVQSHNDLGGALLACGQTEAAAAQLREAIRLRPDFAEAHSNLGLALRDLNQIDEAMQCFREALRINPTYPVAHNNLGFILEAKGRIAEALAEFRESLRLDPNNSHALVSLSGLLAVGQFRFSDEEVRRLQALAARTDLPADDLSRYHYALGRVHDKAGNCDEAFEHFRRANEVRKQLVAHRGAVYDPEAQRRQVDRLVAAFTPAWFERVRPFGSDSELPIFVVGMMRSGTTLAEQILASHPRVCGAGELRDLGRLIDSLPQRLGTSEEYPECLGRLDEATARTLAEEYLQRLRQVGGEAARVVDKMPFNSLHLGVIAALFPRARIVSCRRDPIDICLSCFFQNFAEPHPFTLDLNHLGQYYREHERLMAHWRQALPVPVFELSYEELTADQDAVSRRLLDFCGLDWDERCLRFNETQRAVRTASTLQVRQPLYRSSVGRWKRYQAHLKPLLDALG